MVRWSGGQVTLAGRSELVVRPSGRGLEKDPRPRPGRLQGLGIRPARGRNAPLWRRMSPILHNRRKFAKSTKCLEKDPRTVPGRLQGLRIWPARGWTPLLSGGESHQFCITGSKRCAKYAKWAIYLTVLVFSRLSGRGLEKDPRPRPGRRQGLGIRPARGRCAPLWRRM